MLGDRKTVENAGDSSGVGYSGAVAYGEGKHFVRELFGDRQGAVDESLEAGLEMGRNGLVDIGGDTLGCEIAAHVVATASGNADYILVPNGVGDLRGDEGLDNQRMADDVVVGNGALEAAGVGSLSVGELYRKHSGLNRVKATVEAAVNVVITGVGAIVGQSADSIGKLFGVGDNSSCIAHSSYVFSGIETESCSMTECSRLAGVEESGAYGNSSNSLCGVFDRQQIAAHDCGGDIPVPGHAAIKMYGHYCFY